MRFRVEQVYLTDEEGQIVPRAGTNPLFHLLDAETVDELLSAFVQRDQAEVVGDVLKFPGFQAVATVKRHQAVYTLQIVPVTDRVR